MTDYYIGDIAEETGELFAYWADNDLDMNEMINCYMASDLRENIDKRYASFCTKTWKEMAEQFEGIPGDRPYDSILCMWLGYFYTYLQGYTSLKSRGTKCLQMRLSVQYYLRKY